MLDQDKTGYACKLMKKTNTDTTNIVKDKELFNCRNCKRLFKNKANYSRHQKSKICIKGNHGKRSKDNYDR